MSKSKPLVNIKGIPLLTAKEYFASIDEETSFNADFYVQPVFRWIPEKEEERDVLRSIPDGEYLVGLNVISDKWINRGFCGRLLEDYGLVVDDANPMSLIGDLSKEFIRVRFEHILLAIWSPEQISVT